MSVTKAGTGSDVGQSQGWRRGRVWPLPSSHTEGNNEQMSLVGHLHLLLIEILKVKRSENDILLARYIKIVF